MQVSDLFNPVVGERDLSALSDEDIVIAALCVQRSPSAQAQAENAALLAELLLHARQCETARIVSRIALDVVPVTDIVVELAALLPCEPHADARHNMHNDVLTLETHRNGVELMKVAAAILSSHIEAPRQRDAVYPSMVVEEAIKHITDVDVLLDVVRRGGTMQKDKAATRIAQIGDRAATQLALGMSSGTTRARLARWLSDDVAQGA
jgi:hypothetical protein